MALRASRGLWNSFEKTTSRMRGPSSDILTKFMIWWLHRFKGSKDRHRQLLNGQGPNQQHLFGGVFLTPFCWCMRKPIFDLFLASRKVLGETGLWLKCNILIIGLHAELSWGLVSVKIKRKTADICTNILLEIHWQSFVTEGIFRGHKLVDQRRWSSTSHSSSSRLFTYACWSKIHSECVLVFGDWHPARPPHPIGSSFCSSCFGSPGIGWAASTWICDSAWTAWRGVKCNEWGSFHPGRQRWGYSISG